MKTFTVIAHPTLIAIPEPPSKSPEEQHFLDRLVAHQISKEDAMRAVQTHGLAEAMDIFGYVLQEVARRKGTPKEIRNVSAYLARCLREGYGRKSDAERQAEHMQAERQAAIQQAAVTAQAVRDQAAVQANEGTRRQVAEVMAHWVALPKTEQTMLEQRFLQEEPLWARLPLESMTRIKAFQRWLVQQGL